MMAFVSTGSGVVLLDGLLTEEKLVFVNFHFDEKWDIIGCQFRNVGTVDVVLVEVLLNYKPHYRFVDSIYWIPVGRTEGLCCVYEWESCRPHTITLVTSTGKYFSKTKEAPQRYLPLEVEETTWNSTDNTISIVVENIDMRDQNISRLGMSDDFYDYRWGMHDASEISCSLNISVFTGWGWADTIPARGSWWVTIPAGHAATIVIDWLDRDPWISGKTYFFTINSDTHAVHFKSKAP